MEDRIKEILKKLDPKDQEFMEKVLKSRQSESLKTAVAAIMVRNLSHGLGLKLKH